MKTSTRPSRLLLPACALAFALAALPQQARADNDNKHKKHKHHGKHEERGDNGWHGERNLVQSLDPRAVIRAETSGGQVRVRRERSADYGRDYNYGSRSNFSIVLAEGYRGRGYYYGPPGLSYYNEGPGVVYYPNERVIPREYRSGSAYDRGNSVPRDVQNALAQRGYYRGSIDGAIGSGSRRAISNFQADYGLRVNGRITPELLSSLGL